MLRIFPGLFLLRFNEIAANVLSKTLYKYLFYPQNYSEEKIIDNYFLEHPKPDLWIFDILTTEREWVLRVKKNDVPVVCFDDLKGGLFDADLVINAIADCWNKKTSRSHVLSGSKYSIINSHILGLRRERDLSEGTIKVGVTFGGSDTHGATIKIAQILSQIADLDVAFFLGPHFLHDKELNKLLPQLPFPYLVKKAVENLHGELVEMDVVICGGGQTLFELCAMSIPVLALANEVHEEKTISYFSRHGACIAIGSIYKAIDTRKIHQFFKRLRSEPEEVRRMKTNMQKLVDGKGTSRCYNECIKIIK